MRLRHALAAGQGVAGRQAGQVAAGAKAAVAAAEDDGAAASVLLQTFEDGDEGVAHFRHQRIAALGLVHGDPGNSGYAFYSNDGFHVRSSLMTLPTQAASVFLNYGS